MKVKKAIKRIIIILVILAVLGVIGFAVANKGKKKTVYTTTAVAKSNIVQSVSETGTIKSEDETKLSFLNSGKIGKINFKIGDNIQKDQVLMELDCSDLDIKKSEAEANISAARANYNKLAAGVTKEEINVSRASLQQAKNAYEAAEKELTKTKDTTQENIAQAQKNLSDLESDSAENVTAAEQSIKNAEIALENAKLSYQATLDNYYENAKITVGEKLTIANNALDEINRTVTDDNLDGQLSLKDIKYLENTKSTYAEGVSLLKTANTSLANAKASSNQDNIKKMLSDAKNALEKIYSSLKYCYQALEFTGTSVSVPQSTIDSFKASISTDQTLVTAAISAVQTSEQNINTATISYNTNVSAAENTLNQAQAAYDDALKSARNALSSAKVNGDQQITAAQSRVDSAFEAWQVAQSHYEQTTAPVDKNDILAASAKINQTQAALDTIIRNMDNCLLKSPIDGTITKINYEVGELPGVGSQVISVLGQNNYEIEVLISEADIAKITKGNPAEITLDAFGEDVKFKGIVNFIEPAETIIQDVIYYKVKVIFTETKAENPLLENIKSGMTANTDIITASKSDVLVMPMRAVIDKNGEGKYTRVLHPDNSVEERQVTLGLSGDSGLVEVLSGVSAGENVVTYVKEE